MAAKAEGSACKLCGMKKSRKGCCKDVVKKVSAEDQTANKHKTFCIAGYFAFEGAKNIEVCRDSALCLTNQIGRDIVKLPPNGGKTAALYLLIRNIRV